MGKKQKAIKNQCRQGDVLVLRAGTPGSLSGAHPSNMAAKEPDPRGAVLAEGEMTGHHHRIQDPRACLLRAEGLHYDILGIDGTRPVSLVHEEHGTIPISGGVFEVRRQHEHDWTQGLARRVED